jgi:L-ascorbate metabolism protein UlaG (beta-lactamase superfamily)
MKSKITILFFSLFYFNISAQLIEPDIIKTNDGDITIQPIYHGTVVFTFNNQTIYVDPFGGIEKFKGLKKPSFILITDIHDDHMNLETLKELDTEDTVFITPQAVAGKLPKEYKKQLIVLENRQGVHRTGLYIRAVAMYNLPENEGSRHPKSRGNGYVINMGGKNIYVSGDTEDIPEMRQLFDLDVAFVCMNLPYTMDVNQESSAVLEFKPKIVYPYHYRGTEGLSDIKKFKEKVTQGNSNIEVRLRNWYKK